jgi:hypothetical protein
MKTSESHLEWKL